MRGKCSVWKGYYKNELGVEVQITKRDPVDNTWQSSAGTWFESDGEHSGREDARFDLDLSTWQSTPFTEVVKMGVYRTTRGDTITVVYDTFSGTKRFIAAINSAAVYVDVEGGMFNSAFHPIGRLDLGTWKPLTK